MRRFLPILFHARNRRAQTLYRIVFSVGFVALYVLLVKAFGLGRVVNFCGASQIKVFLPLVILFCGCIYATRYCSGERKDVDDVDKGEAKQNSKEHDSHREIRHRPERQPNRPTTDVKPVRAPQPQPQSQPQSQPQPQLQSQPAASDIQDISPDEAWERARSIPHEFIPHPENDCDYLALVHRAATGGHAEALAKLGEYAFRRGANVEAYFWTAVAQKRGYAGAGMALGRIRSEWMLDGSPGEYDNVYDFFPEAYGTIGRSLLRITCGIDASYARHRLHELAEEGNPYAALFV